MTNNNNLSKTERKRRNTDYLLVLLLMLFSSNANVYAKDPIYTIIPIFISLIVFFIRNKRVTKKAGIVYFVFALYILAYFIKWGGVFDPLFSFRFFGYIALSHLVLSNVGKKFFKIFEDLTYFFAAVSIPLMIIQSFAYSFLYSTLRSLQAIMHIPLYDMEYVNVLFYTMNKGVWRNCGFMWEPGGFATILSIAIIINLARNNFDIFNKRFIVLVLAMILTFSTAGYLVLSIIMFWYLANRDIKRVFFLFPVFFALIIYMSTLPFMTDKILSLTEGATEKYETNLRFAKITGGSYSMGRFAALILAYQDFKENPIIGYGGHQREETYAGRNELKLGIINGFGKWFSQLGIIGITLFLITYYKSSAYISAFYKVKKSIFIFMAFMVIAFSFGVIFSPLFFGFQLAYLYLPSIKS